MGIKKNLDETIIGKLYDEIIDGEWVPGSLISLDQIMDRYEVSRTPVIQALKKMSALGIINFTSKGHFLVPEYTEHEIKDIIDARILLEKFAINRIAEENIKLDFEELSDLCEQSHRYRLKGDNVKSHRKDMEFHRRLIEQCGNACVSELYDRVQKQFMMVNYLLGRYSKEYMEISYRDHVNILESLKAEKYDEAIGHCVGHIMMAYDRISERAN